MFDFASGQIQNIYADPHNQQTLGNMYELYRLHSESPIFLDQTGLCVQYHAMSCAGHIVIVPHSDIFIT